MKNYSPHIGEASLFEACAQPYCPICFLSNQAVDRYLTIILHDYVDAPDLRQQFCDAGGYCQQHAWSLATLERGNLLTIALMYQDLLERDASKRLTCLKGHTESGMFSRLKQVVFPGKAGKGRNEQPSEQPRCPACDFRDAVEANAIQILLTTLAKQNSRLQHALDASDGLCFPHLQRAVALAPTQGVREFLIDLAHAKVHTVQRELREFVRKHDYRFQDEPVGEEKESWKRAINLMIGPESSTPLTR